MATSSFIFLQTSILSQSTFTQPQASKLAVLQRTVTDDHHQHRLRQNKLENLNTTKPEGSVHDRGYQSRHRHSRS